MQQHYTSRSFPEDNSGTETRRQRTIGHQLLAPDFHHPLNAVRCLQNLDCQDNLDPTLEILPTVIGAHRICAIDPIGYSHLCHSHHLITSNFQILDLEWHGAFRLEQDLLDNRYVIYLVLGGSLVQQIAVPQPESHLVKTFNTHGDMATIVGPGQKVASIASPEGKALLISIDRLAINSTLSSLLDRPLKQLVVFQPSLDLTSELGLSLKKLLQFLWESTQSGGNTTDSLVIQKLEQAVLACTIEGLPSNYTEEILYQTDGALACHVRKARTFIESHLHEDIKLGDIAAATQVCSRLLQKAFSHHCGCSPMRFLTQSRLQRIRQELEAAPNDTKIVDVMMQYGFTQGGKFAKEYQQLFGEKPSETLKRRRQFNNPAGESPLWQQIDDPRSARVFGGASPALPNLPTKSRFLTGWRRFFNDQNYLAY